MTSITLFKLRVTTFEIFLNFLKSKASSTTMAVKLMDAKLQTATSSGDVYSTISVQRLLDLIVPRCFWLLFPLQASL